MIAWKENSWGGIRKGDDFMIYEFYLDDIIVRCDKCVKDEQNFLHLYRSNIYIANICLDTYLVFTMHKSENNIIFGLKKR